MTPAGQSNKTNRVSSRALVVLFVALLWLPMLDSILKLDHCPAQDEKRRLATFPDWKSIRNAGNYLAGLQQYFDDHFGFRNQLVHWNNHWKLALFDESPVDMAMQGRNGWLYWAADNMLADYSGTARFDNRDLNAWQKLLEARRDWLAARGAKYVFVIAPDKHTIYPEYLPAWVGRRRTPSKLDQFLAHMRAHSTVQVLDLRPALLAAKDTCPTYFKTDTHWNYFGAFVAYQQIIRSLGMNAVPLDAFDQKIIKQPRGGDLAVCLDERDELPETQAVELTPRPPLFPLKVSGTGPVTSENPNAAGKAVVYRDSFGEKWYPFLGYNFGEVVYFRQVEWNKQFLEREKPNLVIDETVERLFNGRDPLQVLKKDDKSLTLPDHKLAVR